MGHSRKLWIICLVAAVLWPSLAQAEGWQWKRGEWREHLRRQHGGVAGELALFAAERDGADHLGLSPRLGLWWAPAEHFELSLDWGMAFWKLDAGATQKEFRFGNPVLNGYWIGPVGDFELSVGAGVGLPAATLPDGMPGRDQAIATYSLAAAMRGLWNIWEWYPGALTIVVPARFGTPAHDHLLFAIDGSMGIPIHVQYGDGAELVLQWAAEIGYRSEIISLGARFQMVWLATDYDEQLFRDDLLQMAFEPFLRINIGQGFIHSRLTMNLDDPYGFSFDEEGGGSLDVWALHVGAGGRW